MHTSKELGVIEDGGGFSRLFFVDDETLKKAAALFGQDVPESSRFSKELMRLWTTRSRIKPKYVLS